MSKDVLPTSCYHNGAFVIGGSGSFFVGVVVRELSFGLLVDIPVGGGASASSL